METPVSAYLKLGFEKDGTARDNAFLLESVQGGETRGTLFHRRAEAGPDLALPRRCGRDQPRCPTWDRRFQTGKRQAASVLARP
jgi:hypothetical protein